MDLNGALLIAIFGILSHLSPVMEAADQGCEFYQYLEIGKTYYIYNEEYPLYYKRGTNCLWWGQSPPGTRIFISCEDIDIPNSINCWRDKLKISLNGDVTFSDSKNYCGTGSASLVSNKNGIAVELVSAFYSGGGKFVCLLTAIRNTDAQPLPSAEPPAGTCDCGWKKGTRIVNGVETLVNEFPAMAGLIDSSIKEVICGSTIISNRYVISAAHCMRNIKLENMGVLVGDWNISSGSDTTAAALYQAEKYWEHPDFDIATQVNDLAIVRTKAAIRFSLLVGPICLPFLYTYNNFESENVTILGWGQQFFNGPTTDVLEKAVLEVVSNEKCQMELPRNTITPNQICTYTPGTDACQRDSGGPLLWQDSDTARVQLVGVISYGLGCATTKPGVNTRVTSYLPWIVSVTSDANYCVK